MQAKHDGLARFDFYLLPALTGVRPVRAGKPQLQVMQSGFEFEPRHQDFLRQRIPGARIGLIRRCPARAVVFKPLCEDRSG